MNPYLSKIACLLFGLLAWGCQSPQAPNAGDTNSAWSQPEQSELIWDEWGVPHIYARSEAELFYLHGWAQMQSHANLILELYAKSRGAAASYWGEEYLYNDVLIHTLGFPKLAQTWHETQNPEFKQLSEEFVKGMNAYAQAHPEAIDSDRKAVLPIVPSDITAHFLFVIYTRFVGGEELGRVSNWKEIGSNTYAIGPKRSASGNAMLVQNPHLPWWGEFLFYESQLVSADINSYGVTLLGFPVHGIAFNEKLGWSHTNNTIDNADIYELSLQGEGYVLDGEEKAFEVTQKTLQVKSPEGEMEERTIDLYRSEHGPILKKGDKKALAFRIPGLDQPNPAYQWYSMAKAQNFEQFENALQLLQIPFFNVMYADQEGNIFYMFNGIIPKRNSGDWSFWNNIVPGNTSEYIWQETHPYEDLPKFKNPEQAWIQNANDPPWTSTFPQAIKAEDFPPYIAPQSMYFRPQRSARMLAEDESITFEELQDYKLSTRMELADRILDDLNTAVEEHGSEESKAAMDVLNAWDRQANADSKGAALFYMWANKINPYGMGSFATPWDAKKPRSTPDGLSDPKAAVEKLNQAAQEVQDTYGSLDVAWGEVCRIRYAGKDLPGNGADGSVGIFRVAWGGPGKDGKLEISGGDTWVGVIEFGEKVQAKILLSYGNSTQDGSPHHGDQLELFSKKEFRDAWYYREALDQHIKSKYLLKDGTLTEATQD